MYKKKKHKKTEGRVGENKNLTHQYSTVFCPA